MAFTSLKLKLMTPHLYVHKESNYPRGIIENNPKSVNKRLIPPDEEVFMSAIKPYQDALNKSGHKP